MELQMMNIKLNYGQTVTAVFNDVLELLVNKLQ